MTADEKQQTNQIACPGDCGNQIHKQALTCPRCGYRSPIVAYHGLFQSLSVASSILLGFTINGLITIAVEGKVTMSASLLSRENLVQYLVSPIWIFASVLLFAVLIMSEISRHRHIGDNLIRLSPLEEMRIRRRCDRLISCFVVAALGMLLGMIALAFYFTALNGILGIVATIVSLYLVVPRK